MKYSSLLILFIALSVSCQNEPTKMKAEETESQDIDITMSGRDLDQRPGREPHPELPWHVNAAIYEVNTRQFSKEGTFSRVTEQLPRLTSMGVQIIWMMPIHPIGEVNRKGKLGSPYSISDYKGIHPDYGSLDDFKALVRTAHQLNLKVIIDWVANHTAFDHVWAKDHLNYYTLKEGKQVVALDLEGKPTDWTDVADLNFENDNMRAAMIDAMKYWITECDIDGFRCDVAGFVPLDFWKEATAELEKVKPNLFWLAEWDSPEMHEAFKMTYGWDIHHIFNDIAQGKSGTEKLAEYMKKEAETFPADAYRMYFTTNHDENSWNGTIEERMGKNGDAMTALAFTLSGVPLVYNGQESNLNKRLSFFDKDEIDWSNRKKIKFYQKLLILKQTNKALWNADHGGKPEIFHAKGKQFGFVRKKGVDAIMVMTNFDDKPADVDVDINMMPMTDIFNRTTIDFSRKVKVTMRPHSYMVFQ